LRSINLGFTSHAFLPFPLSLLHRTISHQLVAGVRWQIGLNSPSDY
jgi:hypothetical protein